MSSSPSAVPDATPTPTPRRHLGVWSAISVCVGMVIGAGIFKTSPEVAAHVGSDTQLYALWIAGGVLSIIGAMCFAELAAAYPDTGGDYSFLHRAFGPKMAFLFAWSRFSIIHTGSMALLAFVFADYVNQLLPLGPVGGGLLAGGIIVVLVLVNLRGLTIGLTTQLVLMALVLLGLLLAGAAGLWLVLHGTPPATPVAAHLPTATGTSPYLAQLSMGTAMVFVLLAYGGWSDAATLSAEMRDERRGIVWALLGGMSIVMALYLLANWAYLQGLGLTGLARSEAPAAELLQRAFGTPGEVLMVAIVAITAISVMNAILIAGARTTYAVARDTPALTAMARWDAQRGTPVAAMLAMAAVALVLVALGTITRGGFSTMVDYLSPVYWLFLTLSATAVLVLRQREPTVPRPFKVPFYPVLPIVFGGSCAYMLWASLDYVRAGALAGVGVLLLGAVLLAVLGKRAVAQPEPETPAPARDV